MKHYFLAILIGAAALTTLPTEAAVSVSVGQPGFYGRIDIGGAPVPQVLYPQPIVIQPVTLPQPPAPIYLRVPPGHAHKWSKHCQQYNACDRPVYFVSDNWYQNVYVPHYQKEHGKKSDKGHGKGKDK
ncbi:MAG: hypothetical protein ABJA83_02650 [Burkholderiaceae bacterium]